MVVKNGVKLSIFLLVSAFISSNGSTASNVQHQSPKRKFKSIDQLSYNHRMSVDGNVKRTYFESAKISGRADIIKQDRAPGDLLHTVVIAIKNRNIDNIQEHLKEVSNPLSQHYGKHLTAEEVAELSVNQDSFKEINKYLEFEGIMVLKTSRNKGYITAEAPVSKWEEVFGNEFHLFKQTDLKNGHLVRAVEYSLPDILVEHVEAVFNVVQFPGEFLS